jgi:putative hydrolase of the HAD superfamily
MRAVVLDIGGVLELTPATGWDARWEQRLGLAAGDLNRRCAEIWDAGGLGRITEAEVGTRLATVLGLSQDQLDGLLADLWQEYLGTPNNELIAYVGTLRDRCRLGILSNSFVGAREREKRVLDLVHEVVYSHEIGINKPDPRAFADICARLGSRPEDCLFIDDNPPNIAAARGFGMPAHLFTDNPRTIAAVEAFLRA